MSHEEKEFWMQVYAAAIRHHGDNRTAKEQADRAVEDLRQAMNE